MEHYLLPIQAIEADREKMVSLLSRWVNINTHTFNIEGLEALSSEIERAFSIFKEKVERVPLAPYQWINNQGVAEKLPLAPALLFRKRPSAKRQALLVCHLDTVYPLTNTNPSNATSLQGDLLKGPGVADAKGGIVVLLKALELFEKSPEAKKVGWQVFLNSDEEIGSPSSQKFLQAAAEKHEIGFVFEPCLPNGNIVGARKGSGNFTLVVRGQSAHAGRDHHLGRNAIDALAKLIVGIRKLNHSRPELTVNFGVVQGGSALNVVPDLAIARFNIRFQKAEDKRYSSDKIQAIMDQIEKEDHVRIELVGGSFAPPKLLVGKALDLHKHVQAAAATLGLKVEVQTKASGGVCDGNRLNAAGLPTVDTMGAQGNHIHSSQETVQTKSLVERAGLAALCLAKWAGGEWEKKD